MGTALQNGGLNQIIYHLLFFGFCSGVFKINFEPACLQSLFVFTFCRVEYLLIRRVFRQPLLDGIWNLLMTFGGWFDKL